MDQLLKQKTKQQIWLLVILLEQLWSSKDAIGENYLHVKKGVKNNRGSYVSVALKGKKGAVLRVS